MKTQAQLDRAFLKGQRSYDTFLGDWWTKKSLDAAHGRAYRNAAATARAYLKKRKIKPRLLVDYACGAGGLIEQLVREFPDATIVGLDGSESLLDLALQKMRRRKYDVAVMSVADAFARRGPQVRLARTALPNFQLPSRKADVAFFLFPNMNFSPQELKRIHKSVFGDRAARNVARILSRLPDLDQTDNRTPKDIYEDMLYERAIAASIHGMLRKGGHWLKADYSKCGRSGWSDLTLWRMLFSESAFDVRAEEWNPADRFVFETDKYYRSSVILDVHDQTHDPSDSIGGYVLSVFRAR